MDMSVRQMKPIANSQGRSAVSQDDVVARIKAAGHTRTCGTGESLYDQGDECVGVYYVESGLVGLRKIDEEGASILVSLVRDGDFVGYSTFLTAGEYMSSAEVLQPSRITFIDAAAMRALVSDVPAFSIALMSQATRDLTSLEDKFMQMATRHASARLASVLLTFSETAGTRQGNGACAFRLPILNKDLADLIGIRAETLSRAIGELRKGGLIACKGREVQVPCMAKLARLAGSPAYELAA